MKKMFYGRLKGLLINFREIRLCEVCNISIEYESTLVECVMAG